MSIDNLKAIISWGEYMLKIVACNYEVSQVEESFRDDDRTMKELDGILNLTYKAQEKALKTLARIIYGKYADRYTPEETFRDYLCNYRSEQESIDAVKESAMEMFNILFDVVNELDGEESHTELVASAQGLIAEIESRQQRRGLQRKEQKCGVHSGK